MDTDLDAELAAVLPRPGAPAPWDGLDPLAAGRCYLELLAPGGWIVPAWPVAYGGRGADADEALRITATLARFARPDLYPYAVGLHIVGPTLLVYGTQEQRARWCASIATGAQIWCQMFSEPAAGSDLAGVTTRAEPSSAGAYTLRGQKVWTSRGEYADVGLCLARTDPTVPKHAGLSMFAVPMREAGVIVRPLVQMNGDAHFSEVFLDDCAVAGADVVGAVGAGWTVASTALSFERTATLGPDRTPDPLAAPEWLSQLSEQGLLARSPLRQRAMQVFCQASTVLMTQARLDALRRAGRPGAEGSGQKLRYVASYQAVADLVSLAGGLAATMASHPSVEALLTAPSMSIRGGTDEVQRNIVGERVLGLPRDPFRDTDVPWNELRSPARGR